LSLSGILKTMYLSGISHLCICLCVGLGLLSAGCGNRQTDRRSPRSTVGATQPADQSAAPPLPPDAKLLSKNVYFEKLPDGRRRVLVNAYVCLREGEFGLECLLCRRGTKEHESILAADVDARTIHAGLLAAGAEPGAPVVFDPEFRPPA